MCVCVCLCICVFVFKNQFETNQTWRTSSEDPAVSSLCPKLTPTVFFDATAAILCLSCWHWILIIWRNWGRTELRKRREKNIPNYKHHFEPNMKFCQLVPVLVTLAMKFLKWSNFNQKCCSRRFPVGRTEQPVVRTLKGSGLVWDEAAVGSLGLFFPTCD